MATPKAPAFHPIKGSPGNSPGGPRLLKAAQLSPGQGPRTLPMKSPGMNPAALPSPASRPRPAGLPSPGSKAGLFSPGTRPGQPSPGSNATRAAFPSKPANWGRGPQFTTFDWSASIKKEENGGMKPAEDDTGIKIEVDAKTDVDFTDFLNAASLGQFGSQASRRRLKLSVHYSKQDHEQAAYARKMGPTLGNALQTNATDEGYKKKALAIAHRIAHCLAVEVGTGEERHRKLLKLNSSFKDPENQWLRDDVVNEVIPPEIVVQLPEEKLLAPEIRRAEAKARKSNDDGRDETQAMLATMAITTLFACPRCKTQRCYVLQKPNEAKYNPMGGEDAPESLMLKCTNCGFAFHSDSIRN